MVFKNKYNDSQISIYTDEKKRKGNGFLSKKVNFVEREDIIYYIGMVLTGKKYYIGTNKINKDDIKIYVNFQYVLDEINILHNYFIFHNINTDEKIMLEVEHYHEKKDITTYILKDHFDYSYCKTCHSSQGLSIDNDITIFDCNISPYVDKKFTDKK